MSNAELKAKFVALHKSIVDLNLSSVFDELCDDDVISAEDKRRILCKRNGKRQAMKLLKILHASSNPQAFIKLREAIAKEKACSSLVKRLDRLEIADNHEDSDEIDIDYFLRVVHTLTEKEEDVFGVTSLCGKLYVLREHNAQIEIYSTREPETTSQLVTGPCGFTDMTSCEHHRCLYVADEHHNCVRRVELKLKGTETTYECTSWPVNADAKPCGLSVTPRTFNVLVTCRRVGKLFEYTTDGKQLHEIDLHRSVVNPHHAIRLPDDQFVVCHGDVDNPDHRLCIVDASGHVTQSYGGPRGSATVDQLFVPSHVAVDRDGSIFVADHKNRRVLLLSPTRSFVRVAVSGDQLKWQPWRLFLDVRRRLLYVADNESFTHGRVIIVRV